MQGLAFFRFICIILSRKRRAAKLALHAGTGFWEEGSVVDEGPGVLVDDWEGLLTE